MEIQQAAQSLKWVSTDINTRAKLKVKDGGNKLKFKPSIPQKALSSEDWRPHKSYFLTWALYSAQQNLIAPTFVKKHDIADIVVVDDHAHN